MTFELFTSYLKDTSYGKRGCWLLGTVQILRAWFKDLCIRPLHTCSLYSQSLCLREYKKYDMAWLFLLTLLSQRPQKFPEQSWLLLFWKLHRDPTIKFSCPIIILAGWQRSPADCIAIFYCSLLNKIWVESLDRYASNPKASNLVFALPNFQMIL